MYIKVGGFYLNVGLFVAVQDHGDRASVVLMHPIPSVGDVVDIEGDEYSLLKSMLEEMRRGHVVVA